MKKFRNHKRKLAGIGMTAFLLLSLVPGTVLAAPVTAMGPGAEVQKSVSEPAAAECVQVESAGAALYDPANRRFLFEKNGKEKFYPASTTKLMTALLIAENCRMDETVTFTRSATENLEAGACTLGSKPGEKMKVSDCMYGLLLKSANEVANALAEHEAGSIEAFVKKMNDRAAALGCTGTHFANPSGLNDKNHYTTPRDMALIAEAALLNPTVRRIALTLHYDYPATKSVSSVRKLTMGHKMLDPKRAEYYEGFAGGKTGYTSLAGNTLVTAAERDGRRLIAVVLKSRQTHYKDTKLLLDYGFETLAAEQSRPQTGAANPGQALNPGPVQQGPVQQAQTQQAPGAEDGAAGHAPWESQAVVTGTMVGCSGPGQPDAGFLTGGAQAEEKKTEFPEVSGTWKQEEKGWRFVKEDGTGAAAEFLTIGGQVYGFAGDGLMMTGWQDVNGYWRYFKENGAMARSRWIETGAYWYYTDEEGKLFVNGTTPDGYKVDRNGVWVQTA